MENETAAFPSLGTLAGAPQVWRFDLDAAAAFDREDWLDAVELAHARRLHDALARRRYIRSHALARHLLAQRLGIAPDAVVIERTARGKPFVAGVTFDFSLSHSKNIFLFGLHHGGTLGVDVEIIRDDFDVLPVAEDCLSPAEYASLHATPAAEQRRLFHRLWANHEARAKATGRGMTDVALDAEREWSYLHAEISVADQSVAVAVVWKN